eukprot:30918-Pelagococcus_subviridis.AAC.43
MAESLPPGSVYALTQTVRLSRSLPVLTHHDHRRDNCILGLFTSPRSPTVSSSSGLRLARPLRDLVSVHHPKEDMAMDGSS